MQDSDKPIKDKKSMSVGAIVALVILGILIGVGVAMNFVNSRLETINSELAALKPPLPVNVSFRQALTGDGLVAAFHNESKSFLSLKIELKNPTFNKSVTTRIDLSPDETKEIGYLEGWSFASGDEVNILNESYEKLRIVSP